MDMSNIFANVVKTVKSNSPEILTALGVGGVVATSILSTKATAKSIREIDAMEHNDGIAVANKERIKDRIRLVWKNYIPPVISGVVTIGCIIGSNRAGGNRTAAAVAAYSLTERAFSEYKEKVVEQLGEGKEQKIRDEIAAEKVQKNPSREVMITSVSGHVLCCELYTGRYLFSDMESLRRACNDLNKILIDQIYASLDEFYDLIGLSYTSNSCNLGWDSDRFLELHFSTVMSDNGEPCLAFEYNYVKPIR
jgi:Family of unknown function (DUF6353)